MSSHAGIEYSLCTILGTSGADFEVSRGNFQISIGSKRSSGSPVVCAMEKGGLIRIFQGSFTDELSRIITDDNIVKLCMLELKIDNLFADGGSELVVCSLHGSSVLRLWCVSDGSLVREYKLSGGAVCLWSCMDKILVQTGPSALCLIDPLSGKEDCALTGFSNDTSLRHVAVDGGTVAVVDGRGQVWMTSELITFDDADGQKDRPICRLKSVGGYFDVFSVSLQSNLLALFCPMKIILHRIDGEKCVRTMLVDDVGKEWGGGIVLSPRILIGWTKCGKFYNVFTEDEIRMKPEKLVSSLPSSVLRWDRHSIVSQDSGGRVFMTTFVSSNGGETVEGYNFPIKFVSSKTPLQEVVATDNTHLFLASLLSVDGNSILRTCPLAFPACSFELETPRDEKITCISGTAQKGRLLAGSFLGSILRYRVGTSQIESLLDINCLCKIVGISYVNKTSFCALDLRGIITVVNNEKFHVHGKIQPNWLPSLLAQGYLFTVTINDNNNTLACTIYHPFDLSCDVEKFYRETWSAGTAPFHFIESGTSPFLSASTKESSTSLSYSHVPPPTNFLAELFKSPKREDVITTTNESTVNNGSSGSNGSNLVDGVSVEHLKRGLQILSFDLIRDYQSGETSASASKELLLKLLHPAVLKEPTDLTYRFGIATKSKLTGTLQVGTQISGGSSSSPCRLGTLIFLTTRFLGKKPPLHWGKKIQNRLHLPYLVSLVSKSTPPETTVHACFQSTIIAVLQSEFAHRFDQVQKGVIALYSKDENNLWLLLLLLSTAPNCVPGYSNSVKELSSGFEIEPENHSKEADFWLSVVQVTLKQVHANSWLAIKIFALCYCHLRKFFIADKPLMNEIFVLLFRNLTQLRLASSRETSSTDCNLPEVSEDCLIAIGLRNPTKFGKRIALLMKTTHSAIVPLQLLKKFIETHTRHSLTFLPVLFERVVLPCLDPMDYRVRKSAVGPITDLFRALNKEYPMTAFHQGKQKFAVGTTQGQVYIYDIRTGTKWRILDGHTGAISAIGFDVSGKHLCSYSATDCTVRVWHITGGGMAGVVTAVVVNSNPTGSVLGGLIGLSGGKCIVVKQLGPIEEDPASSGIKHPFNLAYRISGVKIRWTSDVEILIVRENARGIQLRI